MTNIYDSDILITQASDNVFLDLVCGFGQPSVTTVYLKKNDGTTDELNSFDNNTDKLSIGSIATLKYNAVEIHTTIHDIRERDRNKEEKDISLEVKVYDSDSNFVDTKFTKNTKGKGHIFHSFYTVTIL